MNILTTLGNILVLLMLLVGVSAPVFAATVLPVPVATIYPGELVVSSMLRDARFYDSYISKGRYIRSSDDIIGKIARRTIISGRPIPQNSVRLAFTIQTGQLVTLRYVSGSLTIIAKGVSLKSARVGQMIQTRNIDTGLRVIGIVRAGGLVEVLVK